MQDQVEGPGRSVLEQLFEVTQEGFWHLDNNAVTLDVNPAMCHLLGYAREDFVGRSVYDFIVPASADTITEEMAARKEGIGGRFEVTFRHRNGHEVLCLSTATPLTDQNGNPTGSIGLIKDISERKHAEWVLQQSEARFRDFAQTASDWFWETDADLRYTSFEGDQDKINGHIYQGAIGHTRSQVLSRVLTKAEKSNIDKWEQHLADLGARQPFRNLTYERHLVTGEIAYTKSSGKPVFDSVGEFMGYRGSASDVTEEVLSNIELARTRDTMDRTLDCLFTFDPNSLHFSYVNQGAVDQVGYAKHKLMSMTPVDLIPEFDEQTFRDLINPLLKGQRDSIRFETVHETKTGDHVPVEIVLQYLDRELEGPARCVAVVRDITARKKITEAILEREAQTRLIVDNVPVLINYLDTEQRILFCNAVTEKWYGRPAAEIIGKTTWSLFSNNLREQVGHRVANVLAGEIVHFQEEMTYPDGIRRFVDVTWVPHKGVSGSDEVSAYFVLATDISATKQNETDLVAAKEEAEQANRVKSDFLANMSHELRTPLNAINGYAQMVEMEPYGPLGDGRYTDYVGHIRDSGDHLLDIIDDILDLTRIEAGKMKVEDEVVDLGHIMQSCLQFLDFRLAEKSLTIMEAPEEVWPNLWADPRMVRQMLLNLLSNAMKFSKPNSSIEIGCWHDSQTGLEIRISDHGIGMNENEVAIAMQRFGQVESILSRSNDGTGLGLPLVRSLIELHGGEFRITSTKSIGTNVCLVFPPERVKTNVQNIKGEPIS
jgi:PAS domain S-box-containing protein